MGNLAVGTDGAGSVRIPCSFTGLFGLKPTQGRVPLWPPSAQGTLSHIGPMTRTVRDAAMMMNVMARPDPRDLYGRPDDEEDYLKGFDKGVKGLRIAYSPNLGFVEKEKIDRDVAVAVENAAKVFRTLGAKVVEDSPDLHGPRSAPHPERALAVQRRRAGQGLQRGEARADGSGPAQGRRGRRPSRPGGRGDARSTSASRSA